MPQTLINPSIVINQAVKNKYFCYYTELDRDKLDYILIKHKSYNGRKRGIVGKILRNGTVVVDKQDTKIQLLLTKQVRLRIEFALDLIYGAKRDREIQLNKRGFVILK